MGPNLLRHLPHGSLVIPLSRHPVANFPLRAWRAYAAVHREHNAYPHAQPTTSSILSETLDQKQRGSRGAESVGPFQLGLAQPSFGQGKAKPWSELSAGGKAVRATARTTNLAVILFGAGLTTVLVYALSSELFSRNSPTVLYNEACESIKASPRVARYFSGPLTFHNNPPSMLRPRHRKRNVSSQLIIDSAGREHLLLNFYIQASSTPSDSTSYVESVSNWTQSAAAALPDLSWDEIATWAKSTAMRSSDYARELFHYLTGDPESPRHITSSSPWPNEAAKADTQKGAKGFWEGITGVFSSVKVAGRHGAHDGVVDATTGKMWQEGEVHADLVKDAAGNFVFRYILIDIPDSRGRKPLRVFVRRGDGVHENEPVMRWEVQ